MSDVKDGRTLDQYYAPHSCNPALQNGLTVNHGEGKSVPQWAGGWGVCVPLLTLSCFKYRTVILHHEIVRRSLTRVG